MRNLKSYFTGKRNKRGSIDDLVYIIGTLLAVGLLILLYGKFTDEFNTAIQANEDVPDDGKVAVSQINDLYGGAIDNGFLFLALGLCIAAMVMAMLVIIHPVFFVFYLIILTIVIFVSAAMSNIYQEAASNPELADIAAKLVFTSHILTYLPYITGVFGFILAIVMYKKWDEAQ